MIDLPGWTGTIDELSVLDVCPLEVGWWCWEKWGWWPGKRGGGLQITEIILKKYFDIKNLHFLLIIEV